jgi:hypothetical protein
MNEMKVSQGTVLPSGSYHLAPRIWFLVHRVAFPSFVTENMIFMGEII